MLETRHYIVGIPARKGGVSIRTVRYLSENALIDKLLDDPEYPPPYRTKIYLLRDNAQPLKLGDKHFNQLRTLGRLEV